MQENGTISIHTENIFPIIKKFLYSDHEIFLRELVANATDATQKIKRLSSLGELKGDLGDLTIRIAMDKEAKTITISDQGIGMTAEEVKKYINQVAFSGAEEFVEKFKEAKDAGEIIGKFGLGFYSAFMVAEKVEIETLSGREGATAVHWSCDGSTSFELSEGHRQQRGTDIVLHLNADSEEFLEEGKIRGILDKYCRFLPVPIQFGTRTEHVPDGEDQDGKPKFREETVPDIINDTTPIWTKAPSDLADKDYLKFYRELYPFSEPPLFWIHLNVDYPFNLTGILYFPRVKNELELQRNKIKLFSRQVFITDEVKDIVPEFLMLLHGVIDSPDIPLNVSRSFLQADSNVKKINGYISRKVADKLAELYKKDRKDYESKWSDIALFVKYGMVTDDKFYDKAKDFALLENVRKEFFTLSEYTEKVKNLQTDKDGNTIFLYATDADKEYSFVKAAGQKGYDVLLMNSPIDNHFINLLEQKLEKTNLKRVDADTADRLIPKEEKTESVLTETQSTEAKDIFEKAINETDMEVSIEGMSPDALPVTITMDEFMRRMKEMAQNGGGGMMGFYGNLPDKYKVTINGNHPLIREILAVADEEKKTALAKQAYDLALLSRNMLTGEALIDFVNRSVQMMTAGS
ncbi:MAG TPA: molecular chaperone HtpG [Edaphocola sp.]|nr:molecular chaperone HtpG [Edaphocola sp.]